MSAFDDLIAKTLRNYQLEREEAEQERHNRETAENLQLIAALRSQVHDYFPQLFAIFEEVQPAWETQALPLSMSKRAVMIINYHNKTFELIHEVHENFCWRYRVLDDQRYGDGWISANDQHVEQSFLVFIAEEISRLPSPKIDFPF